MASRLNLARTGAVLLGAAAAFMVAVLPASADTSSSATVDSGHNRYVGNVTLKGGASETTALIALKASNGSEILTYCVDIKVGVGGDRTTMVQVPWTSYPDQTVPFDKNSGQINWVLHHSFPSVDLTALSTTVGTAKPLDEVEAVEGTQAAIWHFSDGKDLAGKGNNADVTKLYKYLVANAVDLPQPPSDPRLDLVSPDSTSGRSGDRIGPFTVDTNLQLLTLTSKVSDGVTVEPVDAGGKAVDPTRITDGTKVYFDVPAGAAAGGGSVTITGDLQLGQLFVGKDVADAAAKPGGVKQNCKSPRYQSLIVAESDTKSVTGAVSWVVPPSTTTSTPPTSTTTPTTSAPTSSAVVVPPVTTAPPSVVNTSGSSSLAYTGVSVLLPVIIALVLIAGGVAFLVLQRRRKGA